MHSTRRQLTFPPALEFDPDLLLEVLAQLSTQESLLALLLWGRGLGTVV